MNDYKEIEIILKIIKNTNEIANDQNLDNEKIAYYRDDIRKNIFFLQQELLEKYSETICKYIVFPILAFIDEKLMIVKDKSENIINWDLLHSEYYDRKDGGEYVFEIINNILSDNIYPKICYQVTYLLLDSEFYGKYYDNPYNQDYTAAKKELEKYLKLASEEDTVKFIDISNENITPSKNSNLNKILIRLGVPVGLFVLSLLIFLTW